MSVKDVIKKSVYESFGGGTGMSTGSILVILVAACLIGFYIFMIEANKKQFKKVFNIFLNHPYDCTLFNCSAGKDRTGVIACMLLDLAGCHEYDIVKDYSESYENNMAMIKQLEEMMPSEDEKFLGSDPRVMMKFIAYLRENYGSTKGYLLNIGFSDEEIEEIKENFII